MVTFPKPYFDEALYSLVARYHALLPFQGYKSTQFELFGNKSIYAIIDLPYALESFHSKNFHTLNQSINQIIERNTLFPFYSNFITIEKQQKVLELMKGIRGSTIHTSMGINASLFRRSRFPRYCVECASNDISETGEPYWHLVHQIPDILICPFHKIFLIQSKPELSEYSRFYYLNPKTYAQGSSIITASDGLSEIAEYQSAIHFRKSIFDLNRIDYEQKSRQLNFYKKSSLNFLKIADEFIHFHGHPLLKHLFPSYSSLQDYRWICDIIKRPRHIFHPIRQILVRRFFESFEPSFSLTIQNTEKYECLNKAADHYMQLVVEKISSHTDSKTKRLIKTLTCSCGMVYTLSYSKKSNGDNVRFRRIKEFGKVWMDRLTLELKTYRSFRSIAKDLGTDAKTISILKKKSEEVCHPMIDPISELRVLKRSEWTALLERHTSQKVKKARTENGALYSWLYRNDNSWLLSINKIYSSAHEENQLKLDWDNIDSHLVNEVAAIVKQLKEKKYKGRVTRTLISKIINFEKYIQGKNLNKVPGVKKLLNTVCETIDDYQIRRINDCVSRLRENQEPIVLWKIMRQTGLSERISDNVKTHLQNKVNAA